MGILILGNPFAVPENNKIKVRIEFILPIIIKRAFCLKELVNDLKQTSFLIAVIYKPSVGNWRKILTA